MKERKGYRSELRQEQVDQTRERILNGLIRTMARGAAALSIPAVAREAGVSIPTVYRYFRTKRELVAALGEYTARSLHLEGTRPPRSPDEFLAVVRHVYVQAAELNEVWRAAAMSGVWKELRPETIPGRLKAIEEALAPVMAEVSEPDRVRLRNIILLLASSAMIRAFDDYLGLSGEAAADVAVWAIQTLIRGATVPRTSPGPG